MSSKPLLSLYRRPGFLLRRAHQIASGVFEDECGAWGLTQAQHGALLVAESCPDIDQSGIGLALGFDRATTGEVLRVLEARGLIRRAPSRTDGRKRRIELTAGGREMLRRAAPALERAQKRLLGSLDAKDGEWLLKLLERFCEAFNGETRTPPVRPPGLK